MFAILTPTNPFLFCTCANQHRVHWNDDEDTTDIFAEKKQNETKHISQAVEIESVALNKQFEAVIASTMNILVVANGRSYMQRKHFHLL